MALSRFGPICAALRGGSVGGVDQLLGGRPHRAGRVVTEVESLHPWGCKMVVREHIDMFS